MKKYVERGNKRKMKNKLVYLRKFQDGISYAEGIYNALVVIGFTHPKMKEFSDML